jgi:hypothetical protein
VTGAAAASVLLAVLAGCGSELRFIDAPIVWRVEDQTPIEEPEENRFVEYALYAQIFGLDPVDRALALPDEEPARDTNALDEVPDSTWFENRIGRYALTPEDVARGPGGPPPRLPLVVTKGKSVGSNPGFFAKDAEGRDFLVKLDIVPEMHTGNAAAVSRLFWAIGYHVPTEHVFTFSRDEVVVGRTATYDQGLDEDLPFTEAQLDRLLAGTPRPKMGRYRALASEILPGKPKGGFRDRGRRDDDPNDTIDHEHRRVLRALKIFAIWLDHSDIGENNSLDMFVREDGRAFLRHYLVDFGETLGAHAIGHPWVGSSHLVDYEHLALGLFSFGLWVRPWEHDMEWPFPSVGPYFPDLDPHAWREKKPYYAFREITPADAFWAAKIVLRFERAHLEAAVETAALADPAAARYLVDTMVARARTIGLVYLSEVTALDRFHIRDGRLCMVDLVALHGLGFGGEAERLVEGEVIERHAIPRTGDVCFRGPVEAYERYELRVRRDDELPPIEVHVRGGGAPRILGVVRDW